MRVTIVLSEDLHARLKSLARSEEVTMRTLMLRALDEAYGKSKTISCDTPPRKRRPQG